MFKRFWAALALVLLVVISQVGWLSAQEVARTYSSDKPLERGMLVIVNDKDPNKVEAATTETLSRLYGVVVSASDTNLNLTSQGQTVYVANGGNYDVLVSTQNGPVIAGDYISISNIAGVGMRATSDLPTVIGKALNNFDGTDGVEVKDSSSNQSVSLGRVLVEIRVANNPASTTAVSNLPFFLRSLSENVAQRPVSTPKAYLALVIIAVGAIVAGFMLYSGIRSSIIAIGRNPLSRKSIVKSLVQIIITSIGIFAISLFGVYLLLKL